MTRHRTAIHAFLLAWGLIAAPIAAMADTLPGQALARKVAEIEKKLTARLGVSIIDTGTGETWSHRADERFPLNSTFKAFACAGLLHRVDSGKDDLARTIAFGPADLVTYSPVTQKHAGGSGLSLSGLCEAATSRSDNTAANLVLDSIGGPEGFTAFMRAIGDDMTRLDRPEPELNEAVPGDLRDTTTPAAAAGSLRRLVLGDVLSAPSRRRLTDWLAGNQVADDLLRASLPAGWRIADRSGAARTGSRSVIAVLWPLDRAPLVAAIYLKGADIPLKERNKAVAAIGKTLLEGLDR